MSFDWPEPFGLVMIEAMAYGTPVIAFHRGCSSGSQNKVARSPSSPAVV
ncbi:MAG: glycosyltransferase [Stellaceae bacterium]